jgi:cation transport ATPase
MYDATARNSISFTALLPLSSRTGMHNHKTSSAKHKNAKQQNNTMEQWIKDTAGLGTVLWLMGYLASLVLFFSPYAGIMGWILLAIFTPVTIAIAWWWFRQREPLPLQYYAGVGIAWVLIAIVLDYLFIVLMFQATYYEVDVFVYYTMTLLIPVGVGLYLNRNVPEAKER